MSFPAGVLLALLAFAAPRPQDDAAVAGWMAKLGTAENEDAIAALVRSGKPAVVPLIGLLESGPQPQAWQAMRALRTMGVKADSGKARLVTVFRTATLPAWRRGMAAGALGGMPTGAVTAVDPLVAALRESPVSDLQILCACALVEIGEPSGGSLGKELTNKDREACLWSANLLVELGPNATKAKLSLQHLTESDKKPDEALLFLLQPSVTATMRGIGAKYEERTNINDLIHDLKQTDAKKYAELDYQSHGGVLPIEMMKKPAQAKELLASQFGVGRDDPAFVIALPDKFEDWDRSKEFSTGELVQGLGNHVAAALHPLRQKLESDSIRSWEQWQKESAELRGLLLAVHALTRPEFLEKSRCLEWSSKRFEGLYPRDKK